MLASCISLFGLELLLFPGKIVTLCVWLFCYTLETTFVKLWRRGRDFFKFKNGILLKKNVTRGPRPDLTTFLQKKKETRTIWLFSGYFFDLCFMTRIKILYWFLWKWLKVTNNLFTSLLLLWPCIRKEKKKKFPFCREKYYSLNTNYPKLNLWCAINNFSSQETCPMEFEMYVIWEWPFRFRLENFVVRFMHSLPTLPFFVFKLWHLQTQVSIIFLIGSKHTYNFESEMEKKESPSVLWQAEVKSVFTLVWHFYNKDVSLQRRLVLHSLQIGRVWIDIKEKSTIMEFLYIFTSAFKKTKEFFLSNIIPTNAPHCLLLTANKHNDGW